MQSFLDFRPASRLVAEFCKPVVRANDGQILTRNYAAFADVRIWPEGAKLHAADRGFRSLPVYVTDRTAVGLFERRSLIAATVDRNFASSGTHNKPTTSSPNSTPATDATTPTALPSNSPTFENDNDPKAKGEGKGAGREQTSSAPKTRYEAIILIDDLLEAHPVVVFMRGSPAAPLCPSCARMVGLLEKLGIERYVAVDVSKSQRILDAVKELATTPTIPQLFVRKENIGGADALAAIMDHPDFLKSVTDFRHKPDSTQK